MSKRKSLGDILAGIQAQMSDSGLQSLAAYDFAEAMRLYVDHAVAAAAPSANKLTSAYAGYLERNREAIEAGREMYATSGYLDRSSRALQDDLQKRVDRLAQELRESEDAEGKCGIALQMLKFSAPENLGKTPKELIVDALTHRHGG